MTSYIETLLVKHVKLSSIDEAKLLKKRASLSDSLELTNSIAKEVSSQASKSKAVDAVGAVVMITSLVSDIIRDSVGETLSKELPLMKLGLTQIYDKARDDKWKGNKYEKQIDAIKKNGGYLEKFAKADKTGMIQMTVNIHKNMLMNAVGLIGYLEDAKDIQRMLANSIKVLQKNIEALEEQRRQIDFYLETGEGGTTPQRFTPAQPALTNRLS